MENATFIHGYEIFSSGLPSAFCYKSWTFSHLRRFLSLTQSAQIQQIPIG